MFKHGISVLVILAGSVFSQAQTTDSITGKWKFKDIYHAETMDSAKLGMLRKGFANMSIYLKNNQHYNAFLFKKEEGTWQYNEATKELVIISNKGAENHMGIIAVTGKTLVLNIGKDKSMVLERTTPDASDEVEEIMYNGPLVSATKEQITKKWYIVKREVPGVSEEITKTATGMIKGAYFDIKANQTYTAEVLNIKDEGSWEFAEENKAIIMTAGKEKKRWQIKSVSDSELILVKGTGNELWTLSTKL